MPPRAIVFADDVTATLDATYTRAFRHTTVILRALMLIYALMA